MAVNRQFFPLASLCLISVTFFFAIDALSAPASNQTRHAYSPFNSDSGLAVEPTQAPKGEVVPGSFVIKIAPPAITGDLRVAISTEATVERVREKFNTQQLRPIFPNAKPPAKQRTIRTPDGKNLLQPDLTRWYRIKLSDQATNTEKQLEELKEIPGVEWAEPEYIRRLKPSSSEKASDIVPSRDIFGTGIDPLYDQSWHLGAAKVPDAWDWLTNNSLPPGGDSSIIIAVIDTGVDYFHPDLAANMWQNNQEIPDDDLDNDGNGFVDDVYGVSVVSNELSHSGDPMDDHGHGTHVAGIIAAQRDNGIGGVGVAYNTKIMAIKAAQYSGVLSTIDIAEAINYAVEQGADIINMSFGGYVESQLEFDALTTAFGQAVLVAAAGNNGKENYHPTFCRTGIDLYPAAYNWVLGVMASMANGQIAAFSNFDCIPHDTHEYELMAPGVDIWSTLPSSGGAVTDPYAAWDGTSMAAPIVSGVAALLRTKWSDKNSYSSRFIMGQIASNANPVVDASSSLTMPPAPELSYLEHWLFDPTSLSAVNDNDGIVDSGEAIDLAIVIHNHWGRADSVSVTLEPIAQGATLPDPYVNMLIDQVDYGAVGSFSEDDNGFIYDAEGVITGVANPFRFQVDRNTPNDHIIPFRLTMTGYNGLDPGDTSLYTFNSYFSLMVQRGRELPRLISTDMTLTKDDFWIVPDETLITAGATLHIEPGTQVQFGTANSSGVYDPDANPLILVEGSLIANGTEEEPIEMFPGLGLQQPWTLIIDEGILELRYTKIYEPVIDSLNNPTEIVDHGYFIGNDVCIGSISSLTNSVTRGCSFGEISGLFEGNLLNSVFLSLLTTDNSSLVQNNVFLDTEPGSSQMKISFAPIIRDLSDASFHLNAILNPLWDPDITNWIQLAANFPRGEVLSISNNFWGTNSTTLIDAAISDFYDYFNRGILAYEPIMQTAAESIYPFVTDVGLATDTVPDATTVSTGLVVFNVSFNRDMDTSIQPSVSFGPDIPYTDYTVQPTDGGWVDPRSWKGSFNVNPITGDGYQFIRVADAVAADDGWLVVGNDSGRFRFEIITSGTESLDLQATGGAGYVDLSWSQEDMDLLLGYNLYRSTTPTSEDSYIRVNGSTIPSTQLTFRDSNVIPGEEYHYKYRVVMDGGESSDSNVDSATPTEPIKEPGSIQVIKKTVGGNGTFSFTSDTSSGNFDIVTTDNEGHILIEDVQPGSYRLAETVPEHWSLTNASCNNGSVPPDVAVGSGENVICTFENTLVNVCHEGTLTIPDGMIFKGIDITYSATSSIETEMPAVAGIIVEAPHKLILRAQNMKFGPLFSVAGQLEVIIGPVDCSTRAE